MKVVRTVPYLLIGLAISLLAVLSPERAGAQQSEITIRAESFEFNPPVVTIPENTSITWENGDTVPHLLTSAEELWEPLPLEPGLSYTRFFEEPGTYIYFSADYGSPDGSGMTGTIIVEPAGGLLTSPTPGVVTATPQPGVPATATPAPQPGSTPRIVVQDQESDGQSVLVQEVVATAPGYIVIHESGADGLIDLFNSIGYASVPAGVTARLTVPLDKPISSGMKLFVVLHQDAGAVGVYEYPGPDEPVMVNGQVVSASFIVRGIPPTLPASGSPVSPTVLLLTGLVLLLTALLLRRSATEA
jgi:plastocyanin